MIAQCEFNGSVYDDSETVYGYKYKTSETCSEKEQKTCDGVTGVFNQPLYTHSDCNKWCSLPTGWLSTTGETQLSHDQENNLVIYQDSVEGNSTVRFTRNAQANNICNN